MSNETKAPEVGERVWIHSERFGERSGQWASVVSVTKTGRVNVEEAKSGRKRQFMNNGMSWREVGTDRYHPVRAFFGDQALRYEASYFERGMSNQISKKIKALSILVPESLTAEIAVRIEAAIEALKSALKGDAQ